MHSDSFDPAEQRQLFQRCLSNILDLMEQCHLDMRKPQKTTKEGIHQLYRAKIIINSQLDLNGYEMLPYFYPTHKTGNC